MAVHQKPLEIKLKINKIPKSTYPICVFLKKNEVIDFCFDILKTFYSFLDLDFKFMIMFIVFNIVQRLNKDLAVRLGV